MGHPAQLRIMLRTGPNGKNSRTVLDFTTGGLCVQEWLARAAALNTELLMAAEDRVALEAEIGQLLLEQWDPSDMRAQPEPRAGYGSYAHEVYNLLARGASDTQIGRRLHQAEADELHHPELCTRDLTPLLRALRKIEKRI
jgi:hypothetical protein